MKESRNVQKIKAAQQRKECPVCPHYSYAHGPGKPCKGLDAAGDECDCEYPFNPEPVKKTKETGRRAGVAMKTEISPDTAPKQSTYDWLLSKFNHIDRALAKKPELQSDLDGIIDEIAKTLDSLFEHNKNVFEDTVKVMQEQCAAAICPLCYQNVPRTDLNGRDVHKVMTKPPEEDEHEVTVACKANPIWSMGARLRGLRPTPYSLFVNKMMSLPLVSENPESGQ